MTERGKDDLWRDSATLAIGPSSIRWDGDALTIDIVETACPLPRPVRGRVRLHPGALCGESFALDPSHRHRWEPLAMRARVEVELDQPGLSWSGDGYFDSNHGAESLEEGFVDWQWSRAHLKRETAVCYEGRRRDGGAFGMALRFDREGNAQMVEPPPAAKLRPTGWLMPRTTHADAGHRPRIRRTWEDAPFYARTALATHMFGEPALAVHESLSLDRFRSPVVQYMLPFRMPRVAG